MLKQNESIFKKSNLKVFLDKGYEGQNVTILILDDKGMPFDSTNVETPFREFHKNDTDHNTYMCAVAREAVSKVRIITIPWNGLTTPNRKIAIDWIEEHKDEIDIISCSWGGTTGKEEFERLKDFDIPILCATGNDYKVDSIHRPARYDYTIAIGAASASNDLPTPISNGGPEVDAIAYTNVNIKKANGSLFAISDTSGATIFASSMLACYLSWRKANNLPRLGREEIRKFIHDNCIDVLQKGHDYKSGYGLFVLPKEIPPIEINDVPTPDEPIEEPKEGDDNMSGKDYFKDDNGRWSEQFNNKLAELGILSGDGKGNIRPTDPITREEVSKIAVVLRETIMDEVKALLGKK